MSRLSFRFRSRPVGWPDVAMFTDQTGVALSSTITSDAVTISGLTTAALLTVTGGTYSINGGTYTSSTGSVVNGDVLRTRVTSSGSALTPVECTINIGGVTSRTFTATTGSASSDTTPNAFSFVDRTNVGLSTTITSAAITVSGIDAPAAISVTGGTYSVNGGSFTSSTGTVSNGDSVRARLTSSASTSTAASCAVSIGGVSDTFSATTNDGTGFLGRTLITTDDVDFLGYIRLSTNTDSDLRFSNVPMTMRRVGSELRVLFTGRNADGDPLIEETVPTSAPNTSPNSAPRCTRVRTWGAFKVGADAGDPSQAHASDGNGIAWANTEVRGLVWLDDGSNSLMYAAGSSYFSGGAAHYPTLGRVTLNDGAGTYTVMGPVKAGSTQGQQARSDLTLLPSDFVDAVCPGKPVAVSGGQFSGNASCAYGIGLTALSVPSMGATPEPVNNDNGTAVSSLTLMMHDLSHPQARNTNYKLCGWGDVDHPDSCAYGHTVVQGPPVFGAATVNSAYGENDSIPTAVAVDTGTKWGVFHFGHLMSTPPGYTAPGDADGLAHSGYGTFDHDTGPNGVHGECCDGQDDPFWGSRGPWAHWRMPAVWVTDFEVHAAIAAGTTQPYAGTISEDFVYLPEKWGSAIPNRIGQNWCGGSHYDPVDKRIYILVEPDKMSLDTTTWSGGHAWPTLMVFQVN